MKATSVICILLLLLAGYLPAQAQYGYDCYYSDGLFYCGDECYYFDGFYYWPVPCPQEDDIDGVDGQVSDNQTGNGSKSQDDAGRQDLAIPKGSILMVLPQKDYQEMEFNEPKGYFLSQGFQVKTASKEAATATSSGGESVAIDVDIKTANLSEYIAVVFVGGIGINDFKLYEDQDYLGLAKNAGSKDMVIAAICLAPKILANAGLLNGKEATSSDPDYIQLKGAKYVDQPVVKSGKIITGNGPDASSEFAKAIVAALSEQSFATEKRPITEQQGSLVLNLGSSSASTPSNQGTAAAAKWRCTVCSYIYDPAENNGVSFEQLPADWKCPTCGVGKDKFVKV